MEAVFQSILHFARLLQYSKTKSVRHFFPILFTVLAKLQLFLAIISKVIV